MVPQECAGCGVRGVAWCPAAPGSARPARSPSRAGVPVPGRLRARRTGGPGRGGVQGRAGPPARRPLAGTPGRRRCRRARWPAPGLRLEPAARARTLAERRLAGPGPLAPGRGPGQGRRPHRRARRPRGRPPAGSRAIPANRGPALCTCAPAGTSVGWAARSGGSTWRTRCAALDLPPGPDRGGRRRDHHRGDAPGGREGPSAPPVGEVACAGDRHRGRADPGTSRRSPGAD